MAFTQKLPEWNAPGVEPSESQKQTGFQPGMKPPAQWFNWHLNWSYLALKELQEKAVEKSYVDAELGTIQSDIQQLQEDVQNADIPDASLTVKGKVRLSNKTDGTSQTDAATEKAVNDARLAAATDATTKANAAETNAKNYANTNFRKPSELLRANLVKNSSATLGMQYWTSNGVRAWTPYMNQTVEGFFGVDTRTPITSSEYATLSSESIGVSPGSYYRLQAMFHTIDSDTDSAIYIEVVNAASPNNVLGQLVADVRTWWHRKSLAVLIPSGVTAVFVRLVAHKIPASMTVGFARIALIEGSEDLPYSQERDIRALYEQNELVKQSGVDAKNGIVGAINAKGGSASTSDPWATLSTKIGQIQTPKYATGTLRTTNVNSYPFIALNGNSVYGGEFVVTGLTFKPKVIIIYREPITSADGDNLVTSYTDKASFGGFTFVYTYRTNYRIDGTYAYVTANGFRFPNYSGGVDMTWHAWG
ncbi:tail fiber protein [Paenibacillus sp. P13VS]|uniref:tail fiber protein n=1 Tax=Paenibacillus sp. P13VS TaxID=2697367 RepID=UPI002AAF5D06|nr:tail fiber protein [Paenibacillus sp. P13VS]